MRSLKKMYKSHIDICNISPMDCIFLSLFVIMLLFNFANMLFLQFDSNILIVCQYLLYLQLTFFIRFTVKSIFVMIHASLCALCALRNDNILITLYKSRKIHICIIVMSQSVRALARD